MVDALSPVVALLMVVATLAVSILVSRLLSRSLSSSSNLAGSVSDAVYANDDFVGTPEEIYIKVKARYDSVVSLEKRNQVSCFRFPSLPLLSSL